MLRPAPPWAGWATHLSGPHLLPEFIAIPGGAFWMGSEDAEVARLVKETKQDWPKNEAPRHQVVYLPLPSRVIPTTNAMFQRFWEAGGYSDELGGPKHKQPWFGGLMAR